ncbi:MAG: glycosyltransferase family 1 protein [Alphaproteobacteria bacterium]|nr:glycosyltransferase family 1 protein [Alphaproteobacteria bacterium]
MNEPSVLYITNGSPSYMPPLRLGADQVEMGPNMPDGTTADGRIRRRIEAGNITPESLLACLPDGFTPDLIFIQASSYRCARPIGLARLPGRKFLVIADLHHGTKPLTSMLRYVAQENFDGVIVTHGAHFAHWFEELARCPVALIPNFNVAGHTQPFKAVREPTVLFLGQAGDFHPRRRYLLDAIKQAGLPLIEGQAEPEDAARLYGEAQIVFNCSLNGDINMRVFEVLAAGGCLVTDRLSPQAGLEQLFQDGRHLAFYDDADDLLALLKLLLARPLDALDLARAGQKEYLARHAPETRRRQVQDFVMQGIDPKIFSSMAVLPASQPDLMTRAAMYEQLQEVQRKTLFPLPLYIDPSLPAEIASDAADLVRFRPMPLTSWPTEPALLLLDKETEATRQAQGGQTLLRYSAPVHQD